MTLTALQTSGYLPPGIHLAALAEVCERFATGSNSRRKWGAVLRSVVAAATAYPTMKRVLVWGSFVSNKPEPADLDYSVVVSVDHARAAVADEHRPYFVPFEAQTRFGADAGYLIIRDYPLEYYIERLDFLCRRHDGRPRGIVEISLRGEVAGVRP